MNPQVPVPDTASQPQGEVYYPGCPHAPDTGDVRAVDVEDPGLLLGSNLCNEPTGVPENCRRTGKNSLRLRSCPEGPIEDHLPPGSRGKAEENNREDHGTSNRDHSASESGVSCTGKYPPLT